MLIKKRTIKIIVGVIIAIALIVGGIFAFKIISTNNKIKYTEEKLSQINAEELQEKLINELENSKFSINTSDISTKICTLEKANESNRMAIEIFYDINKEDNPYEKSVSAYITSGQGKVKEIVAIPLFRIETDNNGKFKKIIYTEIALKEPVVSTDIKKVIRKVLKNDYHIDMFVEGNARYNIRFNKRSDSERRTIFATEEGLNTVLNEIYGYNISSNTDKYKEYKSTEFGLEINH